MTTDDTTRTADAGAGPSETALRLVQLYGYARLDDGETDSQIGAGTIANERALLAYIADLERRAATATTGATGGGVTDAMITAALNAPIAAHSPAESHRSFRRANMRSMLEAALAAARPAGAIPEARGERYPVPGWPTDDMTPEEAEDVRTGGGWGPPTDAIRATGAVRDGGESGGE